LRSTLSALLIGAAAVAGCGESDDSRHVAPPGCDARPAPPRGGAIASSTLQVPGQPFAVVSEPSGRWAFASLPSTSGRPALAVLRRDGRRLLLERRIRLADDLQPFGLHVSPGGGQLLVAAGAALISVDIDRLVQRRTAAIRRLAGGAGLIQVIATRDGGRVFATDESRGELVVVDARRWPSAKQESVSRVRLPPAPVGLALSRDERHLFVASQYDPDGRDRGVVSVIDVQRALAGDRGAVLAQAAAGCHPVRVLYDDMRGLVWVSARESHAVLAFDAADLVDRDPDALRAAIAVAPAPVGLALVDENRSLVVAGSNRFSSRPARGRLAVLDVSAALRGDGGLIATPRVGRFPRELAVTHDGRDLLVANFASRSVQSVAVSSLVHITD
jgi:DNA-binding beta-propeller fold protein YncE